MDVKKEIVRIISKYAFDPKEIEVNDRLIDVGISSLSVVEVIIEIENILDITFEDSDLGSASEMTILDLIRLGEKYKGCEN